MKSKSNFAINDKGIAALLAVIVIGAAVLVMALNVSLLGLGELDMTQSSQGGSEVFSLANSCAEEALFRLKMDNGYGSGSLNLNGGSCIISVTGNGVSREIVVAAVKDKFYKRIKLKINFTGEAINLVGWEEF